MKTTHIKKILPIILIFIILFPSVVGDYTSWSPYWCIKQVETTTSNTWVLVIHGSFHLKEDDSQPPDDNPPNPPPDDTPSEPTPTPWSGYWCIYQERPSNLSTKYFYQSFGGVCFVIEEPTNPWTHIEKGFNYVTATKDQIYTNITVLYGNKEYTWNDASRKRIIYKYIWLNGKRVRNLFEGNEYRVYSYKECDITI